MVNGRTVRFMTFASVRVMISHELVREEAGEFPLWSGCLPPSEPFPP